MITLTAPSSLSFDGYQIIAITADTVTVGGVVTIAYRQTHNGVPVDPSGLGSSSIRVALTDYDALAGATSIARASAAVAANLGLASNAFTVS